MTTSMFYALSLLLTSSLVLAQQGDGGAASGNIPATSTNGDIAGAAGSSTGIVKLSTGAIVAIAVVVVVIAIIGISTAVLFFQAKKRQWTVRETLRRSTRRVTTGLKSAMAPLTPHRTTFGSPKFPKTQPSKEAKGMRGPSPMSKGAKAKGIGFDVDMERLNKKDSSDLEKGEGANVVISEKKKTAQKPKMPSVVIPKSNKEPADMPKTPMFNKVFGRE